MEFRVVDFDILTRNFTKYQEGIIDIEKEKTDFLTELVPIKKEMNDIIKYHSSGIMIGEQKEKEKAERFQLLQQEAYRIDGEFKIKLNKMSTKLNEDCFEDLSVIIKDWSMENSIDIVIGKMEVVFNTKQFEITDNILNILKEKKLFTDRIFIE